jgi:hypothetical protein
VPGVRDGAGHGGAGARQGVGGQDDPHYGGIRNGLERSKPKERYPFVQVSQLT